MHNLLCLFIIYSNGAMPLFVIRRKQHAVSYLMCSQAGRACWLCAALLLYPATPSPPPPPLQFPHPTFVSVSCHFPSGMERDSPYDLERSSDRRLPVKKPCFPQYRNRSLDCPAGTRCMYLFHLLLVCVVWQPCGRKRLNPLTVIAIQNYF